MPLSIQSSPACSSFKAHRSSRKSHSTSALAVTPSLIVLATELFTPREKASRKSKSKSTSTSKSYQRHETSSPQYQYAPLTAPSTSISTYSVPSSPPPPYSPEDSTPNPRARATSSTSTTWRNKPAHLRRPSEPWTPPPNPQRRFREASEPLTPVTDDSSQFSPFGAPAFYWDGRSRQLVENERGEAPVATAWEKIGQRRAAREWGMRR